MNNEESFNRAQADVLAMMQKWGEDDVKIEETFYAAIPIFLRALFETAPSTKAAHGMLAVCFKESYGKDL